MRTMLARYQATLWFFALATCPGLPALAEIKATATKSLTVQPAGPRQGEAGSRYFNVEGAKKERYASFGVLVFEVPKVGDKAADVKSLGLRLVQSIPQFAGEGPVLPFRAKGRRGRPAGGVEVRGGFLGRRR